jgi:hypothetical protein
VGEEEGSEVIDLHGDVETVIGVFVGDGSGSRVVDQDVEAVFGGVDLFGELADRLEGGEVEVFGHDVCVVGHFDDFVLGFGGVFAVGDDDSAAPAGEQEGRFEADSF